MHHTALSETHPRTRSLPPSTRRHSRLARASDRDHPARTTLGISHCQHGRRCCIQQTLVDSTPSRRRVRGAPLAQRPSRSRTWRLETCGIAQGNPTCGCQCHTRTLQRTVPNLNIFVIVNIAIRCACSLIYSECSTCCRKEQRVQFASLVTSRSRSFACLRAVFTLRLRVSHSHSSPGTHAMKQSTQLSLASTRTSGSWQAAQEQSPTTPATASHRLGILPGTVVSTAATRG